jgi:O-antigen biosynthesis protein
MAEQDIVNRPRAVVIAGMHRSGTSLLASICQGAGLDIGEHLMGAYQGNEAGHFEDLDFHHWHERLFEANGLGSEGFIAGGRITVPDELRHEAEELVRTRREAGGPWGWKNPRTTLVLPFWKALIPEAVFLGVVRPPWEVIDSLFRRGDKIFRANPPFALDVWSHYNEALAAFAHRHPDRTLTCELAQVVTKPGEVISQLRERFGIPLDDPPERLRPEMLRTDVPPAMAGAIRRAAPAILRLYQDLRAMAGGEPCEEENPDKAIAPLDALLTLWARQRSLEAAAADSAALADEAAKTHATFVQTLNQTHAQELSDARLALDEAAKTHATLVQTLNQTHGQELSDARLALDEAVSRGEGFRIEHGKQAAESAAREAAVTAERDRLASRLEGAQEQARDLQARLTASDTAASGHAATIAQIDKELAARVAEGESLARALREAEATVDFLRGDVERLEAACRENIRYRRSLDEELTRFATSNSWRLTRPLRDLRRRVFSWPPRALDRLSELGRRQWRRLPFRIRTKEKIREFLFTRIPFAFRWTRSYREWRAMRDSLTTAVRNHAAGAESLPAEPVPTAEPPEGLRVIAMHLPQFHQIPENDAWWGEGFTEWTNVRRGRPFYRGHEQPQLPHPDIGFYDLSKPETLERQAAMARRYGVHGFCFYYYWFDGRRLLEKPVEQLLSSGKPDFPFCLCWANENWTRTWDGLDREVLMEQHHSHASDERLIHDLLPYLRDRRYIRVEGRPLVAVYRAGLLPNPAATAETWRRICREEGIGEIHLAAIRSFDKQNPQNFGFDAAIQFPPLLIPAADHAADPAVAAEQSFRGSLFAYEDAAAMSLGETAAGFTMYRGVMPAWDNTPRRQERGTAWMHSSPAAFGRWLRGAIGLTVREQPPERRLVFVNAWNEWAEGAHLEPDTRHGYGFLEETAKALGVAVAPALPAALAGASQAAVGSAPQDLRVLVISHDAHLAGAQMVTLKTLQAWRQAGIESVRIVCVGGGVLRQAFADTYPTTVLEDLPNEAARRRALEAAADFDGLPATVIYSSTLVNGPVLEGIGHLGIPVVTHAHELQQSIERWAPGEILAATLRATDLFMAAAPAIRDNLVARHGIDPASVLVVPAHIDCDDPPPTAAERAEIRHAWHASPDELVVFGCGTTDWRKGPDLFCEIAAAALAEVPGLRFAWAGGDADYHRDWLAEQGLQDRIHFLGTRGDVRRLLHAADIFLLSSREDPMPLVALEAAATSLPVVCFAGAGDIPDLVGDEAGVVVPMEDVAAGARAIVELARDASRRHTLGKAASLRVRAAHDSRVVAAETIHRLREAAAGTRPWSQDAGKPLVSVIVPNYQHAPHLPERLASIVAQGVEAIEIILLDDASTDGSLRILQAFAATEPRARLVANAVNSGSAFRQWKKGIALARGQYIWIAESDDAASPGLLTALVDMLEGHPRAVLAYCQSEMIDERGNSLGMPLEWTSDISPDRWRAPYVAAGQDELATALVHKNTIPNVSGVLFRNTPDLADVIDESMRLCGDWLVYVRLCGRGDVAFSPEPFNKWRQQTSHSRTRPPGELEWQEGQRVIQEATAILRLDAAAAREREEAFRRRCEGWLADATAGTLSP